MSKFDAWPLAFPQVNAEHVVERLVTGFRDLASSGQHDFAYAQSEPFITERLTVYLEHTKARMTVVGQWNYEVWSNTLDFKDRRRRDITFSTVYNNVESVVLIFECKKIDGPNIGSRRKAHINKYRTEGIARFANGSYAPKEHFGFMVSFSDTSTEAAVQALQRSFNAAGWPVAMHMREFAPGKHWRDPPKRFGPLASFETQHMRPAPFPHLTLYHINLAFSV